MTWSDGIRISHPATVAYPATGCAAAAAAPYARAATAVYEAAAA